MIPAYLTKRKYFGVLLTINSQPLPCQFTITMVKTNKNRVVTKSQVRAMIKGSVSHLVELKLFNVAFAGLSTTTGGTVSPVTQGVEQGDGSGQRDGAQLLLKGVLVRHTLYCNTGISVVQRVIVFVDRMNDGATPAVTDVLNTASFLSPYSIQTVQAKRFKILHDECVVSTTTGSNGANVHFWRFKQDMKVSFNGTTNVAASNGRNAVFVLFIGDGTNGLYSGSYEVHFVDA